MRIDGFAAPLSAEGVRRMGWNRGIIEAVLRVASVAGRGRIVRRVRRERVGIRDAILGPS